MRAEKMFASEATFFREPGARCKISSDQLINGACLTAPVFLESLVCQRSEALRILAGASLPGFAIIPVAQDLFRYGVPLFG
jgi:hypothetical protein